MTARVLVVDDVDANVKLLEARLTAEYFEVRTARSGPEALHICSRERADVVLLDVMMPGMDGFEVCRRLKAEPATVKELDLVRAEIDKVAAEVNAERGVEVAYKVGTMIELPRAAVTADKIAASAEFFSFGTNDLTQMTWGFSRDDVEASFFSTYLEHGIFAASPFESLDTEGVGVLVHHAVRLGRRTRPDIHLGVCGEHGGDPASIHFFDSVGLDYVSCSPFRVPVARLEAGRSSIGDA